MDDKKYIYRAGMVPYIINEDNEIQMMFMKPSNSKYGGSDYQIAKGRVDDEDDSHLSTAIREAREELGLFESNTEAIYEFGVVLGRTTLFFAKVIDQEMFGITDEETESTTWMTMQEFLVDGRPLHVPVIQEVYKRICEIEGITPDPELLVERY